MKARPPPEGNLAARLVAAAQQGEILVSGAVRDELEEGDEDCPSQPGGARTFKGFSEPVEVFALSRSGRASRR